ncbi:MAG: S8 family serine peptidase, partial [Bdellovibrionales bacterium]|nr:S8 family serine peptidase [Bdellovibrionales bacterium]
IDTATRSAFSFYSTEFVEISAPGQENDSGIFSTSSPVVVNTVVQDQYHRLIGTSMSAPMVSAAVALAKGLIRQNSGIDPTVEELERLIKDSAYSNPHLINDFEQGRSLDLSRLAVKVVADYELDIPLGSLNGMLCP